MVQRVWLLPHRSMVTSLSYHLRDVSYVLPIYRWVSPGSPVDSHLPNHTRGIGVSNLTTPLVIEDK